MILSISLLKKKVNMILNIDLFLKLIIRNYRTRNSLSFLKKVFLDKYSKVKKDQFKLLISTSLSGHIPCSSFECFLGVVLRRKSVNVEYLFADDALPACMMCEFRQNKNLSQFLEENHTNNRCGSKNKFVEKSLKNLNFGIHQFKEYLSVIEIEFAKKTSTEILLKDINKFCIRGIKLGEHAWSGTLRYFAKGTLDLNENNEKVLRRFFEASILTMIAVENLIKKHKFDCILLHHGIYVPQGVIVDVAKSYNIRIVTWHTAYRKNCFIFSHDDTYHKTMLDENCSHWERINLTPKKEHKIKNYLQTRWYGNNDWINFQNAKFFDKFSIENKIGINFSKPTIGMLTNVTWDAQLHFKNRAFKNMSEWILETINFFKVNKHLQLLIRIHPAEITGTIPSNDKILNIINKNYKVIPKNIFIITPESNISTHSAMSNCNSVIIFGTKMGIELSSIGIPVIVAGEAWIKGKNIGFDANNKEEYIKLLNELPFKNGLNHNQTIRSLKYAYHFFFRRMIPLPFVKAKKGWPPFKINFQNFENEFKNDLGLKVIIDGILHSRPFIYDKDKID